MMAFVEHKYLLPCSLRLERYGLVRLDPGPERKIISHALYSDVELKYPLL